VSLGVSQDSLHSSRTKFCPAPSTGGDSLACEKELVAGFKGEHCGLVGHMGEETEWHASAQQRLHAAPISEQRGNPACIAVGQDAQLRVETCEKGRGNPNSIGSIHQGTIDFVRQRRGCVGLVGIRRAEQFQRTLAEGVLHFCRDGVGFGARTGNVGQQKYQARLDGSAVKKVAATTVRVITCADVNTGKAIQVDGTRSGTSGAERRGTQFDQRRSHPVLPRGTTVIKQGESILGQYINRVIAGGFTGRRSILNVDIQIPPLMTMGGGSFSEVAGVLLRLKCKRPLIVTDPFMMVTGVAERLHTQIREAGFSCKIFHETVTDPTTAVVEQGVGLYRDGGHDSLISLGGGSPIDTAKAIAMLVGNGGKVRDYRVPRNIPSAGPAHIAIPTTAGTGSEVTRFTVITDTESNEKMLIAGSALLPSAAVVDYELTLTMPPRLTADTGTDALTHAIEAFVSRKANPFTDGLALTAMKTIWSELPTCYREPNHRKARESMMVAATQAGIAFSNASVALVHGMSRPLGAHFHVPHGLSNAMLLPLVTSFSAEGAPERYAMCARAMGIAGEHDADSSAVRQLIRALYMRNAQLEVPSPKKFGIAEQEYIALIPTMAAQALASGSPQNNPRVPSVEEIETLYFQAWP
jgi:alcohol dehydrogenase class IV